MGIKVLIAEDNPVTRNALEKQLTAWGMQVSTVTSGSAALKALHEAQRQGVPFATVLIDQCLPDVNGDNLGLTISQLPALTATHPVLMTVMDASTISARIRKVGFYASLTKPLRQSSLYRWLCVALGLVSESGTELVKKNRISHDETKTRHGRLLLVEDNHVNQLVIMTMLKKAGYQVDVVHNGREAVKAVNAFSYDLVLMDLFMPTMDGFEAATRIRELSSPKSKVPIVAMTASALPKHQERCIDVGMNDFLTKPVDRARLVMTIERWLSGRAMRHDKRLVTEQENPDDDNTIDLDLATLEQLKLDTDATLLSRLIVEFMGQTQERLNEIMAASKKHDWKTLQGEAHALKSTAGTFGAKRLQEHARRLERASANEDTATALMLAQAIDKVAAPALKALVKQSEG
jgi:CheY-like chemotaxis protein